MMRPGRAAIVGGGRRPKRNPGSGGWRMTTAESEARKALNRLRRAVEKSARELEALRGAIRHAEGDDFPAAEYAAAETRMEVLLEFVEGEAERLQEKVMRAGGLEPGRVRRSSSP